MAWTKFTNTVQCINCKKYYFPTKYFRCPLCGSEDWKYTKECKEND